MIDLVTRSKPYKIERWNSLWINVSTDTVQEPIFVQIGGGKDYFVLIWHGMTLRTLKV